MVTPVLDEDYITQLLRAPVNADNYDRIQSGAVQALIDLYDRKVTRDEFMESASACVSLYNQCGKLYMLSAIKRPYDNGALNEEAFRSATDEMTKTIRVSAEKVIEIVKRLQMCPANQDKVH